MNLIVIAIERETADLIKNNVRLEMIGDFSRMPDFAYQRLLRCIADTSACTGLTLVLAISYSSRWEITEAVKAIAREVESGTIKPDSITSETVSQHLATKNMPDPDLLIRTGGDFRISNFLLWQVAYSEIYVTSTYWPDFTKDDFCKAVIQFQSRERRFGLTSEQLGEQ
jgi:undecaprenyl diphosphate synthase